MASVERITRHQTLFLRALSQNPAGPDRQLWPSPGILRRWLRRPTFKRALDTLRQTLLYQADFHLVYAATAAAMDLHHPNPDSDPESRLEDRKSHMSLLRLCYNRDRTAPQPEPPPPPDPAKYISEEQRFLRKINQNMPVGEALAFFDLRSAPLPPVPIPPPKQAMR